jgi:hypothetical protein
LPITVVAWIINLASTVFNIYIISACPYKFCGYVDVAINGSNITNNNSDNILSPAVDTPTKYDDFQKFVFTTASFSGTVSYMVIIIVIYMQYQQLCKCCSEKVDGRNNVSADEVKSDDVKRVDPFTLNQKNDFTVLSGEQIFYFYLILFLNLIVFVGSLVLFYTLFHMRYNKSDDQLDLFYDIGGLTSQFYSWLCAIVSCFIFSRVAYAVRNMSANQLFSCLDCIAKEAQPTAEGVLNHVKDTMRCLKIYEHNDDNNFLSILQLEVSHLHFMKSIDKLYARVLKDSLQPYSKWFAIHWLMYTLTAFLSVSYVIESALTDLYGDNPNCRGEHSAKCRLILAYKILFSLGHCMLFLYPCFRAASVTATRFHLIKRVSKAHWPNVLLQEKQAFVSFLKDQSCTFEVSILCTHISFGFDITFYSVLIGMMGVVLKLSL